MRITDLLSKESILLGGSPKSKSEAIDMLVELQAKGGKIADKEEYKYRRQNDLRRTLESGKAQLCFYAQKLR